MRTLAIALALVLAALGGYAFKEFALAGNGEPAQSKDQIEQVVSQYLKDNPVEVLDALKAAQAQIEKQQRAEATQSLASRRDEIFNNPLDPVLGSADADVTVVEFFDYRCPYCKRVFDPLLNLVKSDPKVRVVFKEFPILGPESVVAARIALAAHRQGKYHEVHAALMTHKGAFDKATLLEIAVKAGADATRLSADMEDPAILGQLQANDALAASLGITGTPGFLFGNQLVPGAISFDDMKKLVSEARAKNG